MITRNEDIDFFLQAALAPATSAPVTFFFKQPLAPTSAYTPAPALYRSS